jgi:hypothetical protein
MQGQVRSYNDIKFEYRHLCLVIRTNYTRRGLVSVLFYSLDV